MDPSDNSEDETEAGPQTQPTAPDQLTEFQFRLPSELADSLKFYRFRCSTHSADIADAEPDTTVEA